MARIRLRSLKLTGFKSFPDEVELAFPGKVSAIIGPNGCETWSLPGPRRGSLRGQPK
jgi:ABC-type hemin transport system ATPase subunit